MLARLVDRRYVSAFAYAGIALGAVGVFAVVTEMARGFGGLLAMPGLAMFALRGAQPRPAGSELAALRPDDVEAISVAHAERGWSVGIERKENGKVLFVELETRGDVRTLVRRLRRPATRSAISIRGEGAKLIAVQAVMGAISIVAAVQYTSADAHYPAFLASLLAICVSALTLLRVRGNHVARRDQRLTLERSAFSARTPWDAHAVLHLYGHVLRAEDLDAADDGAPVHALIARGDESVSAWLARLDDFAVPTGGAYRDRIDEPTLRDLVLDESVEVDRRMAAARILKKRARVTLDHQVKDEAARARIAAVTEEDDAADRIEKLGPFFRAGA